MVRTAPKSVLTAAVAVLLGAGLLSAKFPTLKSQHTDQKAEVEVLKTSQLPDGSTLSPGQYKVALLSESGTTQAAFYLNGSLVTKAPVELVDQPRKSSDTEVHYNDASGAHVLTQIDVSGWTKSLVFSPASGAGTSAK